jgi:hypothetical protein
VVCGGVDLGVGFRAVGEKERGGFIDQGREAGGNNWIACREGRGECNRVEVECHSRRTAKRSLSENMIPGPSKS